MFVANFNPTAAPNPGCCSDPHTMCANCARDALIDAEIENDPVMRAIQRGAPVRNVPVDESGPAYFGAHVPVSNQQKPEPIPQTVWNWDEMADAALGKSAHAQNTSGEYVTAHVENSDSPTSIPDQSSASWDWDAMAQNALNDRGRR